MSTTKLVLGAASIAWMHVYGTVNGNEETPARLGLSCTCSRSCQHSSAKVHHLLRTVFRASLSIMGDHPITANRGPSLPPDLSGDNSSSKASIVSICDNEVNYAVRCTAESAPPPVTCGPTAPVCTIIEQGSFPLS